MKRRAFLQSLAYSGALTGIRSAGLPLAFGESTTLAAATFNQVGFLPKAAKVASVPMRSGTASQDAAAARFQIYSVTTGKSAFEGALSSPQHDENSGDLVSFADFSAVTTPGIYRLTARGQNSQPFTIAADVYRDPLRLAMRSYYGQRCGCDVDLGGGYQHAACHLNAAWHGSSGRKGPLANHGGWHDAGDYGRYVVNSGIATATLLWTWELYPQAVRDLRLQIPESNGKIPDFLAEIKWNLQWMLSLQDEDGGVWHKQTSEQFCGFIMPQDDKLVSYVIGTGEAPFKSTCATANLAAVAAIAARCYQPYDAAFAAHCLEAAKLAWSWAVAHPDVVFKNPPGVGTGEYGDRDCHDEILWASAELWRTTGDKEIEKTFLAHLEMLPPEVHLWTPSWPGDAPLAYWTYVLAEPRPEGKADRAQQDLHDRILERTRTAAETLFARYKSSGYGTTLAADDYTWGSNSVAANHSMLLLMADRFHPDPRFVEAALSNLHYLLGRNCFGVSWVTQVGTNPFQHPHHRPSIADGIAAPWPGLLSGGPNGLHPDEVIAKALPKMPPMRMWADNDRAFSLNEVAINWNAPLVLLLAAANSIA